MKMWNFDLYDYFIKDEHMYMGIPWLYEYMKMWLGKYVKMWKF